MRTCLNCKDQLQKDLEEIDTRYSELDPAPARQPGDGVYSKLGFGSKPPLNLHVVAMMDSRSSRVAKAWMGSDGRVHREEERPVLSVFGTLETGVWDVVEGRGYDGHGCTTVSELCDWLAGEIDWIVRQEVVAEFAADLRALVAQLKPATGEKRYSIGRCPAVVDELLCGARLFAPQVGDTIECAGCGAEWPRPTWERLGQLLTAERAAS